MTPAAVERLAALPPAVLADLRARHGEPQRRYHAWSHIAALLEGFDALLDRWAHPQAVFLAIAFHDAVYDPTRADNEAESAALLLATPTGDSDADRARAHALILATATHTLPATDDPGLAADAALFLDLDLSILGAPPALFDAYEDGVRFEYAHVPEAAFRAGRAAILRRFLARPTLYFTDWARDRFEAPARANLSRSLAKLETAAG